MKKCLNVIVLYDNYDEVKQYIDGALVNDNRNLDIVVVVNKDSDDKAEKIASEYGNNSVLVKDFGENVGYLNSLLMTLDEVNINDYQYFVLSNTDIEYETQRFFDSLQSKEYDRSIGCIAPDVYSALTNTHSNPHYKERIKKSKIKRNIFIFSHPLLAKVYFSLAKRKTAAKSNKEGSCYVYAPHGCFMIMTREFISKIKGQRYPVKMYTEEGWVAENLIKNKMKCFYDNELSVIHREHGTTGMLRIARQSAMFRESLQALLDEFYT